MLARAVTRGAERGAQLHGPRPAEKGPRRHRGVVFINDGRGDETQDVAASGGTRGHAARGLGEPRHILDWCRGLPTTGGVEAFSIRPDACAALWRRGSGGLTEHGGGPSQARSGGGVRQGAGRCDGDLGGLGGRGGAGAPLFSSFFPAARMADGPCGRRGHSGVSSFLFRRCLRHYPITRDCPQRRTVRPPGLALRKQMPPRIVRVAHRY